mmetsp:Transcript_32287/g.78785  ORF Transcript_32287/g.78785 Transcript_32287/m.78785 type:complete len:209 (-) Transcript_32287:1487-2113(-)
MWHGKLEFAEFRRKRERKEGSNDCCVSFHQLNLRRSILYIFSCNLMWIFFLVTVIVTIISIIPIIAAIVVIVVSISSVSIAVIAIVIVVVLHRFGSVISVTVIILIIVTIVIIVIIVILIAIIIIVIVVLGGLISEHAITVAVVLKLVAVVKVFIFINNVSCWIFLPSLFLLLFWFDLLTEVEERWGARCTTHEHLCNHVRHKGNNRQ